MANSLVVLGMVIVEPGVRGTTRSTAYIGSSSIGLWCVSLLEWNSPVSSMKSSIQGSFRFTEWLNKFRVGSTCISLLSRPRPDAITKSLTSSLDGSLTVSLYALLFCDVISKFEKTIFLHGFGVEVLQLPRHVFNWKTAKYEKIWYDEDIYGLRSVKTEFQDIAFMTCILLKAFSCETHVSEKDEMNGISHAYQNLKGFYKGVLNLGPDYIRDVKTEEWLTRGHISVLEMESEEKLKKSLT
ncbi:hypothetical protein Tco_1514598 [Tanacetum coccineum]